MKNYFLAFFIFFLLTVQAQKNPKSIKVTYLKSSNGKIIENQDPIILFASNKNTLLTSDKTLQKKAEYPVEQAFVDFPTLSLSQLAFLKKDKSILTIDSLAMSKQKFELINETKKI